MATQPWPDLLSVAEYADSSHWATLYLSDHFVPPWQTSPDNGGSVLEATAVIGALAGCTSRVRLGTLVLSMTYRHPAVLANWAASIDHASNGRLILGVGAGWQANEHTYYGLELGSPSERLTRFAEGVQVITGLLTEPKTSLNGKFYRLEEAPALPKPLQRPVPLLIGASGTRMLRLAALFATQWNDWSTPDSYAANSARMDAACEVVERDPATIHRSTQAVMLLSNDRTRIDELRSSTPLPVVAGTPQQIADAVGIWAERGVDELIITDETMGFGNQRRDILDELTEIFLTT